MPLIARHLALLLLVAFSVAVVRPPAILAGVERVRFPLAAAAEGDPSQIVGQAFNLLMDRFVVPPSSADILNGGWDGALTSLREKGAQDLPEERPAFAGERERDFTAFTDRYPELAQAAEDKLDQTELDRAIIRGMAASFEEGHTYYLNPQEFAQAQQQLRNDVRYGGIGARFNSELVVTQVFEDSPAEASGIRPGDQLVAVDGSSVEGKTPAEASQQVRGEPGTPVVLTVRRGGASETVSITVIRAQIRVAWLSSRVIEDGIGYLQLTTFPGPEALGDFRQAMARFDTAGIRALVIDVRGNGGGSVDTGIEIASRFIRQGPLFQRVDRRGGERTVSTYGQYWERDLPIAVLVDGGSGSMSEILASALQENGVAQVIGTRTSGNVAGTNFHPLADGSGLAVTSLLIKSGQGKDLNGVGLEPDRNVPLDPQALRDGRDTQLEAALDYVRHEAAVHVAATATITFPDQCDLLAA